MALFSVAGVRHAIDQDVSSATIHLRGHFTDQWFKSICNNDRGIPYCQQLFADRIDGVRRFLIGLPDEGISLDPLTYQLRDIPHAKADIPYLSYSMARKQVQIGPRFLKFGRFAYRKLTSRNCLIGIERREHKISREPVRVITQRSQSNLQFEVERELSSKDFRVENLLIVTNLCRRAPISNTGCDEGKNCSREGLPILELSKLNSSGRDKKCSNRQDSHSPGHHCRNGLESLHSHNQGLHRTKLFVERISA